MPFNGTPNELMQLHRTASIPLEKLGGIPRAVRDFLQTLLEKVPTAFSVANSIGQYPWRSDGIGSLEKSADNRRIATVSAR